LIPFLGKEQVPTVAFQVICEHTGRIMAVSPVAYPGSHTDQHISRLDLQLNQIRFNPLFTNAPFTLLGGDGQARERQGVYLIADGGYQYWRVLQQTDKLCSDPHLRPFLAQVASSRKDVECVFGRIKNRFRFVCIVNVYICTYAHDRILKLPQTFDNLVTVHKLFVTCCVLHNMLLAADAAPFDDFQPHVSDILGRVVSSREYSNSRQRDVVITEETDVTGVGMDGAQAHSPMYFHDGSSEPTHWTLRDALAEHYNIATDQRV
jgi:hypothetical protein